MHMFILCPIILGLIWAPKSTIYIVLQLIKKIAKIGVFYQYSALNSSKYILNLNLPWHRNYRTVLALRVVYCATNRKRWTFKDLRFLLFLSNQYDSERSQYFININDNGSNNIYKQKIKRKNVRYCNLIFNMSS